MAETTTLERLAYELTAIDKDFTERITAATRVLERFAATAEQTLPLAERTLVSMAQKTRTETRAMAQDVDASMQQVKQSTAAPTREALLLQTAMENLAKSVQQASGRIESAATKAGKASSDGLAPLAKGFGDVEKAARPAGAAVETASTQMGSGLDDIITKASQGVANVLKLSDSTSGLAGRFEEVAASTGSAALRIGTLVSVVATAAVAISAAATRMAADVDTGLREIRAGLPDPTQDIGALADAMENLATITPRSVQQLSAVAAQLTKVGQSDPDEIAKDLNALALAADAIGPGQDMGALVDLLDQIGDAFELTSEQARNAFLQIVAVAKGRIDINELTQALARAAPQLRALNVEAVDAANGMITLIDAGVARRTVVSGTLDILDRAAKAEAEAAKLSAAGQDGQARAVRALGDAVNETTIAKRGLVGALGDLYTNLDGNRQAFVAAGLSLADYTIAQKAAAAASAEGGSKALTYDEALKKLNTAAAVNRESAGALASMLKNELNAQLIDLGNVFLPTVIKGMELLVTLFSSARREGKALAEGMPEVQSLLNEGRIGFASRRAQPLIASINRNEGLLQGMDLNQLRDIQGVLRRLQNAGEGGAGLSKALEAVEARIKGVAEGAALVTAEVPKATNTFTNNANAAKEAADALARSRDAFVQLLTAFDGLTDAEQATMAIAKYRDEAIKAKVPTAELAQNMARLWNAYDAQLAKQQETSAKALRIELGKFVADIGGQAIDKLTQQFDALAASLDDAATKADKAGDTKLADQFRALLPVVERQRTGLIELAKVRERVAEAQRIETAAMQAADSNYRGLAVSTADLKRARHTLLDTERELIDTLKDPTIDPKVRAEAERVLAELQQSRAKASRDERTEVTATADATVDLGRGLRESAQSALALVQILGQGRGELAQMLSGVVSIANGIEGIGKLAQTAGGFGALLSSGAGIASLLGPAGAIIGGGIAIGQTVASLFGGDKEAERKREQELQAAAKSFRDALNQFVRDIADIDTGEFERAQRELRAQIGDLVSKAVAAAGFDSSALQGIEQSSGGIRAYIESLYELLNSGLWDTNTALANQYLDVIVKLGEVLPQVERMERARADAAAKELGQAMEDVAVRRLLAQGRGAEADAMREQLAAERALEAARVKYAGVAGYAEYVRALADVTAAELKAAAATRARNAALAQLDDEDALFGPDLTRLSATGAKLWPDVFNALFSDLDLSTQEGLQTAKQRIQEWYRAISADGVDDAERPIVDFIKRMFGGITDAITSSLDPLDTAIATALEGFGVFGTRASEQFTQLSALLVAKVPDLRAVLGTDFQQQIGSTEGRAALQTNIRNAIEAILADGAITDAERPLLDALKTLLGLVVQSIDDATTDAQNAAATAEANRQARITQRQQRATADVEFGDLTGADAFGALLRSYTEELSAVFAVFDVTTLGGITAARTSVRQLYDELAQMSDAEIAERFGMTREEVTAALFAVNNGLRDLGSELEDLATKQTDFLTDLNLEYLEATGQGLDAVKLQTQLWVAQMLAMAEALGLATDEVRAQITAIGDARVQSYLDRQQTGPNARGANGLTALEQAIATQTAQLQAYGARSGTLQTIPDAATDTARGPTARDEFVASDLTRASATEVLRLTDIAWMHYTLAQRGVAVLEQVATLLAGALGLGAPLVLPPALPATAGASGAGSAFSAGGLQIVVNVNGPVMGMTGTEAGQLIGESLGDVLNAYLARLANLEARNIGVSSLS